MSAKCITCDQPNDNGEGWEGMCGDCADMADDDAAVARWAKMRGEDFDSASDDGQLGMRIEYVQAKLTSGGEDIAKPSRGAFIEAARAKYDSDTIAIDDNAILSEYDEGAWVLAWVDVSNDDAAAHEGDKEADTANATPPFLGYDVQQQLVKALDAARSVLADSGCELAVMEQIDAALAAAGRP